MSGTTLQHTYEPQGPDEEDKLAELAEKHCEVKPGIPHGITIVFRKNSTVNKTILVILDPSTGEEIDVKELTKPLEELVLDGLVK
ncbi:MAG: hypothetical protein WCK88_00075 [bacterium]